MSNEFVIKTNHLSKNFGDKKVIKDCNMNVKTGSVYCLVGKNGAGKIEKTVCNIIKLRIY